MAGVFREGHNKRPPRNRGPIVFEDQVKPWRKHLPLILLAALSLALVAGWSIKADAGKNDQSAQSAQGQQSKAKSDS